GDEELISRAQALDWFDLSGINKAPARLDLEKMAVTNSHYIAKLEDEAFVKAALPFLDQKITQDEYQRLVRGAPQLKDRCKTLKDIEKAAAYLLLKRPFEVTGKAAKPLKQEGVLPILSDIQDELSSLKEWSINDIDLKLQSYADTRQLSFGKVGPPIRASVTAGHASPGLAETLYALGKEEVLSRLADRS
ncbi:MAG: glutamate--tRNA ligase, partial [Pseudomonadota bacterium]